jgi:hypothetical protein
MELVIASSYILFVTVVAVVGLWLVRKKVSYSELSEHHEVANPMVSIVSTLYSVLLGFLVVCAFNRFDACRSGLQAEANALSDVFHLANGLPTAVRKKVQNDCINYISSVIDEEFPLMHDGKSCHATRTKVDALWTDALTFEPKSAVQSNIQQEMLQSVRITCEKRRERIFAMDPGLWPVLWAVLIAGTSTIVLFTYFFAMKRVASQLFMVGALSFMLALNVYLVIDFSCPFQGAFTVSVGPMLKQRDNLIEHVREGAPEPAGEPASATGKTGSNDGSKTTNTGAGTKTGKDGANL